MYPRSMPVGTYLPKILVHIQHAFLNYALSSILFLFGTPEVSHLRKRYNVQAISFLLIVVVEWEHLGIKI